MGKKKFWILIGLVLAGLGVLIFRGTGAREQPNILIMICDAVRPDHLGCYGYPASISPNVDKIASEGVVFLSAITPAPYTLPAMASLMTSNRPFMHGARQVFIDPPEGRTPVEGSDCADVPLADSKTTLAEILKERGYATAAFVSTSMLDSVFGMDQGFDTYDDEFEGPERRADLTSRKVLGWLEKNANRKFFLWVHYYDPHIPYDPPPPFDKIHDLSEDASDRERSRKAALYDGEIAFMDKQIGLLMSRLETLGLNDRTIVVILSDHGEHLGERNGYFGHGTWLYDRTLKIALIIKYRRLMNEGKKITGLVRTIDIAPTLVDILGLPPPEGAEGVSLLPMMMNRPHREIASVYSESDATHFAQPGGRLRSIRTSRWKYIYAPGGDKDELYDLLEDPGESNNIKDLHKDLCDRFRNDILALIKDAPPLDASNLPEIPDDLKEKLKSLGYL